MLRKAKVKTHIAEKDSGGDDLIQRIEWDGG
nr:MAG TPA: hypothetical protein [Caudoviricetes sp.]